MSEAFLGHDVRAVSNAVLRTASAKGIHLTLMQLLKLIFFAHGWQLALLEKPLSKNKAQAWQYGPVFPHVYKAYPGSGSTKIANPILDKATRQPIESNFSEDEMSIINQVVDGYGPAHAFQLSNLTHETGSPWDITFKEKGPYSEIPDSLIATHFKALLAHGQNSDKREAQGAH